MSDVRLSCWPITCLLLPLAALAGCGNRAPGPEGGRTPPPQAPGLPRIEAVPAPDWEQAFRKDPFWIGSDCAYSVPLGDDTVLWLFGDTFYGKVQDGKRLCAGPMARNSVGLARGRDPGRAEVRFCFGKDAKGGTTAFVSPPDGHGWFWFGPGIVTGGRLWLFLWQMESTGENSMWGFRLRGTEVAEIANFRDPPDQWQWKFQTLPWFRASREEGLFFGNAALGEGGAAYVYGVKEDRRPVPMRRGLLVAKAPADRLGDFSTWRFLANGQWTGDWQTATAAGDDIGSEFSVSYVPAISRYVLVYSPCDLAPVIKVRCAPTPAGPWSAPVVAYRCPDAAGRPSVLCYAAKGHPELSPAGGLLVTYATNSTSLADVLADARLYYPRFVLLRFAAP